MTTRTSIQRRLVALTMLTSTAVLILTGAALIIYDAVSFRRTLVAALNTRAAILAVNSSAALDFDNPEDASQVLAALKTDPHAVAAALYDARGRLFASYPEVPPSGAIPATPLATGARFEENSLVVFQPILDQGRKLGTICLRSDLRVLRARQRIYVLVVLLAIIGSMGVAFALSSWLQRSITRPIQALALAARRVSEDKDYSIRAEVTSLDELGVLTNAFNEMLNEIQRRDLEIRQLNTDLERRVAIRTAELEATNRELEAFTYSVSHDLRAPVRHVAGFADLLEKKAHAVLDDIGRRYLNNIADSAKRMGNLIDDLLMFSRMARSELQATRVSLDKLLGEVIRELEPELKGRKVDWQIGALPTVQADPAMLRLVLTNLVSNAVKYTSPRPEARIEIRAEEQDGETVVSVRDNGVGFDMEYLPKLFGVFQRLHAAEEFEGTGIGLANVRRIVYRHGGRTWAEGQVDHGATFYFSLPELAEAA
jgi:signal transduction histidine kinase